MKTFDVQNKLHPFKSFIFIVTAIQELTFRKAVYFLNFLIWLPFWVRFFSFLVEPAAHQQSDLSSHYDIWLFVCLWTDLSNVYT